MIGRPEYTLTLPPPCPTNRDHLIFAREFFIGYREIPPTHIGFVVLNAALAGC